MSTYILWTTIIHMIALMEIIAVPNIHGTHPLQNEYAITPDGPLSSINSIDSPTQFQEEDIEFFQKIVEPPECAKGSSYCENVDSYPYAFVESSLENSTYQFHDPSEFESMTVDVEIKHSDDEEVACKSFRRHIRPKIGWLATDNNEWMHIVNNEKRVQIVEVEECRHFNECQLEDVGDFARCLGYESRCKQNMLNVELLAILPNKTFASKIFRMPSSCQCVFKRTESWRGINMCNN